MRTCPKGNNKFTTTHGKSHTKTYRCYRAMIRRCYNKSQINYERYGNRGIKVCDRWLESFENFLEDIGECPKGYQLDRIDNDGNYEPNNCRWVTPKTNANNRRPRKQNIKGNPKRLNREALKVIFFLKSKGISNRKLAKAYKLNPTTVQRIINGKRYTRFEDNELRRKYLAVV